MRDCGSFYISIGILSQCVSSVPQCFVKRIHQDGLSPLRTECVTSLSCSYRDVCWCLMSDACRKELIGKVSSRYMLARTSLEVSGFCYSNCGFCMMVVLSVIFFFFLRQLKNSKPQGRLLGLAVLSASRRSAETLPV